MSTNRFTVADNTDRQASAENGNEIKIERSFEATKHRMVWTMTFEELVHLQESIGTFIAGERLG